MGITEEALSRLHSSSRGMTLSELAASLGRHPSTVYLTIERARLEGCCTRSKAKTRHYVYKLTPYGVRKLKWLGRKKR